MKRKVIYAVMNIILIACTPVIIFVGFVGIEEVVRIDTAIGFISMCAYLGYVMTCAITTAVSIKTYYAE